MEKRTIPAGRMTREQFDAIKDWAHKTEQEIFSKLSFLPEEITNVFPPQPKWERYIRRLYINDAEQEIFQRLSQIYEHIQNRQTDEEQLNREFPENTWWGKYVRELYDERHGQPYHPRVGKQIGVARAIAFYKHLEETKH